MNKISVVVTMVAAGIAFVHIAVARGVAVALGIAVALSGMTSLVADIPSFAG